MLNPQLAATLATDIVSSQKRQKIGNRKSEIKLDIQKNQKTIKEQKNHKSDQ